MAMRYENAGLALVVALGGAGCGGIVDLGGSRGQSADGGAGGDDVLDASTGLGGSGGPDSSPPSIDSGAQPRGPIPDHTYTDCSCENPGRPAGTGTVWLGPREEPPGTRLSRCAFQLPGLGSWCFITVDRPLTFGIAVEPDMLSVEPVLEASRCGDNGGEGWFPSDPAMPTAFALCPATCDEVDRGISQLVYSTVTYSARHCEDRP